jgi:hypothetical protein
MYGYSQQPEDDLGRAIVKVIIFFDLFDYPVTAYEIWENLDRAVSLSTVLSSLADQLSVQATIAESQGFYYLSGRSDIVQTRIKRYNYSCRKLKLARRWAKLFSFCPFIKLVALSNSFGDHNWRDSGDLDFFIVCADKRIWLSRLYCTGLAKILNRRPNAQTKRDRVCLSFYVSESHLDLTDLKIAAWDPHFHYWRRYFFPLYDCEDIYQRFLLANKSRPRNQATSATSGGRSKLVANPKFSWLQWLELAAKNFQLKILPPSIRRAVNLPGHVVITDEVLKFHEHDKRQEILEKYGNQICQIIS